MPLLLTRIIIMLGITLIVFSALLAFASFTNAAEGAGTFVPLADVEGSNLAKLYTSSEDPKDLTQFLNTLFTFALSIGAILAVLRIAYAGYMYIASDLWTNKEKAKTVLQETVLGLLLLLAVWVILYQINPEILNLKINVQKIPDHSTGLEGSPEANPGSQPVQIFYSASDIPSGRICFDVKYTDESIRFHCAQNSSACSQAATDLAARTGTSDYTCETY